MTPFVVAILPARLTSSRLPEKVLLPLGDRPVLKWVVDRVNLSKQVDRVVVATTTNPTDDRIADFCKYNGIFCFRGSETNVLGRFISAADFYGATLAVRVNPDNPLVDPLYLDELVTDAANSNAGYVSYELSNKLPVMLCGVGFFAEAIQIRTLKDADRLITDTFEREHVTLGIYKRPETFRVRFLPVPPFCDNPDIRLTLDTSTDFQLLSTVVSTLGANGISTGASEIVELLHRHPEWLAAMREQNRENPKTITR